MVEAGTPGCWVLHETATKILPSGAGPAWLLREGLFQSRCPCALPGAGPGAASIKGQSGLRATGPSTGTWAHPPAQGPLGKGRQGTAWHLPPPALPEAGRALWVDEATLCGWRAGATLSVLGHSLAVTRREKAPPQRPGVLLSACFFSVRRNFFLFLATHKGTWKLPGQGSRLPHSCGHAGSLTHCTAWERPGACHAGRLANTPPRTPRGQASRRQVRPGPRARSQVDRPVGGGRRAPRP